MSQELNKCVWMWAGLLTYRLCDRDFQCSGCPVDALFHPAGTLEAGPPQLPAGESRAAGSDAVGITDRFSDAQHLWLRVLPRGRIQIGFDPMAARLLRSIVALELPKPGTRLRRGETALTVWLRNGSVRFASPVSGEVVRRHDIPLSRIQNMLARPYSRAWLLILDLPHQEHQLSELLFGRDAGLRMARDWSRFEEECIRLSSDESEGVLAMPDGGNLDLERLERWAGSEYPALIAKWIGTERCRAAESAAGRSSLEDRNRDGGTSVPPGKR